jgi:DNA-binding PadR family transcriptional regulator
MSLRYAMLGFIDMMPLTGYDLKKLFNSSVKYYWTATHSQIYRTLDEMKKSGLIREEYIPQTDLPNKKLYHITEKGKLALYQWAARPADIPPVRHALLVQLSWAAWPCMRMSLSTVSLLWLEPPGNGIYGRPSCKMEYMSTGRNCNGPRKPSGAWRR